MEDILTKFYEIISVFGLQIIVAVAILFFGKFFIKYIKKIIIKLLEKRHVDAAIVSFVSSLSNAFLWIFVIVAALSQVGVQTTSFIAVLGAAGLAVGLALQGSLSNFAAGFLIILFRPFKVGDAVEAGGIVGAIKGINMFHTEFRTFDNKKVIVPNSQIMNSTITNITAEETRRVDFVFGVAYNSDIQQVKDIVINIIINHELVLKEPEPMIRMSKMNNSSLDFTARAWSNTADYWKVYFDVTEQVKEAFDKNKIEIPFPQMDVHIKNKNS